MQTNSSKLKTAKNANSIMQNLLESEHDNMTSVTNACLHCFDAVGWVAGRASGL